MSWMPARSRRLFPNTAPVAAPADTPAPGSEAASTSDARDALRREPIEGGPVDARLSASPRGPFFESQHEFQQLKNSILVQLLDELDFAALNDMDERTQRQEIRKVAEDKLAGQHTPLNILEKERFIQDILNEVLGLGPLEAFLQDANVSDILVNGHGQIYIERFGKLERTQARFIDDVHLSRIIERIVSNVGRRIDESSPMVDARLADGSRVNAIIPPLALDGPSLSIRRFAVKRPQLNDLIATQSLTREIGILLKGIVQARLNVLISGGTGSGKTTLLNVLSGFIPASERIITIEDSAELQLQQEHVVRLETRPPNIEGRGEVTQRDLVRNCLRMRPDRVILGEVRGQEALDMLQAMNTGHDGSLTTIHANSPRDALTRVETMVAMAGFQIPPQALRHFISSALDVIIQVSRLADGTRKLISLQEITGMEGEIITMQELFAFEQTGMDVRGHVKGRFMSMGITPQFAETFRALGIEVPLEIFDPQKFVEV